jgi:hypothetical protein
VRRARDFDGGDRGAPIAWEPSGEDFLSPCLAEADLMRRVLEPRAFAQWFDAFLPEMSSLQPVVPADPSDGKLAHLDGLNLSRAWMLAGISGSLPAGNLRVLADAHATAGRAAVTGEHYEGGHWLGTFAVYLLSQVFS